MQYVGIDYHTKYAVATRMEKDGTIISQDKIANNKEEIRSYLSLLPENSKVALEATNNWYALVEWSHDLPLEIILANPGKTKAIAEARIKTDKIDSRILADLLRSEFIAQSYLAPQSIRDVRELIRYRTSLVRIRTQFITRIYSVLFKTGEEIKASSVTGKRIREKILQLPLRSIYKDEINSCYAICDYLDTEIAKFEEEIKKKATVNDDARLLMTVPGISFFSSLLITSEIGDYRRFSSSRKLCSFAGLVPSVSSSGGKTRMGSITKIGSKNLRFVLLQSVNHVIKKSQRLSRLYYRVKMKRGSNTARITITRKLLSIMFAMLKERKAFMPDC